MPVANQRAFDPVVPLQSPAEKGQYRSDHFAEIDISSAEMHSHHV
jgi:hypothetical protein